MPVRPKHKLKVKVWIRDKGCLICGSKENLTVDHLKQVKDKGKHLFENLKTLCRDCHTKKDRLHLYTYNFNSSSYEIVVHKLGSIN